MELSSIRKNFGKHRLLENELPANPLDLLRNWLNEANQNNVPDFNAMVVSTVNKAQKPSSRVVLLKEVSEKGQLIFFTNYESRKGIEISENKFVAINFFWTELERQIRIEGTAKKISRDDSKIYFQSRPVESQVSAIISPQSKVIKNLEDLKCKAGEMLTEKTELILPENWGGYAVEPDFFEFWQGGSDRLHDRIVFQKSEKNWELYRLAP